MIFVDRIGRRPLALVGSVGMVIGLALEAWAFSYDLVDGKLPSTQGARVALIAAHALRLLLRDVVGRRRLGLPRRDVPDQHPRRGARRGRLGPVARQLGDHRELPVAVRAGTSPRRTSSARSSPRSPSPSCSSSSRRPRARHWRRWADPRSSRETRGTGQVPAAGPPLTSPPSHPPRADRRAASSCREVDSRPRVPTANSRRGPRYPCGVEDPCSVLEPRQHALAVQPEAAPALVEACRRSVDAVT